MKEWHDIKFYTVPELAQIFMLAGHTKSMQDDLLSELLFCSPLVLRESLARNRRMVIGKVMEQKNPWDIVIHDEQQVRDIQGTNKLMLDPLLIQLKEVFSYGLTDPLGTDQWMQKIKETIRVACKKYVGREPVGILHLYNRTLFNPIGLKEFEEKLALLQINSAVPFRQISITVDAGATGVLTWQLYPSVHAVGSLGQIELPELKKLYGFD